MKGLLLKDYFTLMKQMKIFIIMIILFSVMPGFSATPFAVVYAVMIPITALAYDERSKWDTLAAMMPYSPRSIVLSKYILGYLTGIAATLLAFLSQSAVSLIRHEPMNTEDAISLVIMVCASMLILSVNLPIMYKFGVEKGRVAIFTMVAVMIIGGMAFGEKVMSFWTEINIEFSLLLVLMVITTIVINLISLQFSTLIYQRK